MADNTPSPKPQVSRARLHKLARDSGVLGSLDFFARLDRPTTGQAIDDTARVNRVIDALRGGLREVMSRNSTLYGWHVQAMFLEMVAALGDVVLLKEEDQGTVFFEGTMIKVPDYRVVTGGGDRLLVEAKNCRTKRPAGPFSISAGELTGLRRYAELDGTARLKLAIYWSHWNLWTLIDPAVLAISGERAHVSLPVALKANEMATLGDVMVGTRTPLSLTLFADPKTSAPGNRRDGYPMTIARVEMRCAGKLLETKEERRLALFFMLYGPWKTRDRAEVTEDKIQSVTFDASPDVPDENVGFDNLGFMSSLFSSYFNSATLSEDMTVRALGTTSPAGFVGALIPESYHSERLPLWRFVLKPADKAP